MEYNQYAVIIAHDVCTMVRLGETDCAYNLAKSFDADKQKEAHEYARKLARDGNEVQVFTRMTVKSRTGWYNESN